MRWKPELLQRAAGDGDAEELAEPARAESLERTRAEAEDCRRDK